MGSPTDKMMRSLRFIQSKINNNEVNNVDENDYDEVYNIIGKYLNAANAINSSNNKSICHNDVFNPTRNNLNDVHKYYRQHHHEYSEQEKRNISDKVKYPLGYSHSDYCVATPGPLTWTGVSHYDEV